MPKLLIYLTTAVGLSMMTGGELFAQANREYRLKASYIYHFCRLTPWPSPTAGKAGPPRSLVIGILGANPFLYSRGRDHLRDITNVRQIGNRRMEVRLLTDSDDIDCDLLFIPEHARAAQRLRDSIRKIGSRQVFIVTENKGLASQGAMVNFYIRGNRVRLEMNSVTARRARLPIAAQLLGLNNATDVGRSQNKKKK